MAWITRRGLCALMLGAVGAAAGQAEAAAGLARPLGKVILRVSGKIDSLNENGVAAFDLAMLEAMPQHSFTTKTPWYVGPEVFEGILMSDLMQKLGASGSTVLAIALNDYSSEIPVADFARYGVLLALKRGGKYMPVRDKGPLFIIYPFDADSTLQSEKFFSRSAWQVSRLIVS